MQLLRSETKPATNKLKEPHSSCKYFTGVAKHTQLRPYAKIV